MGAHSSRATSGKSADHIARPHGFLTEDSLICAIRRSKTQFERPVRINVRTSSAISSRSQYHRMGPVQKIMLTRARDALPRNLNRFAADNLQWGLLKQAKCSLPWMASDVSGYTSFCDLTQPPHFPPEGETIRRRSSSPNSTATVGDYISPMG